MWWSRCRGWWATKRSTWSGTTTCRTWASCSRPSTRRRRWPTWRSPAATAPSRRTSSFSRHAAPTSNKYSGTCPIFFKIENNYHCVFSTSNLRVCFISSKLNDIIIFYASYLYIVCEHFVYSQLLHQQINIGWFYYLN